jgi:ABC-type phosphate/phosphonate transport system substrate-binding protein
MDRKIAKTLIMTLLIGTTALAGCLGNGDENDASDLESLVIAFSIKDDYTNVDENPQRFADYLGDALNMDVSLYPIDSEGAALQALRFGNADIALMDGGAAWVGWQQYGLEALAADQNQTAALTTAHMQLFSKIQKLPQLISTMTQAPIHSL